jgi:heme A synthase
LAFGYVLTDPRGLARGLGAVLLLVLLAAFGQFHRELITQRDPSVPVTLPISPLAAMGVSLGALLLVLASGWNRCGTKLRLLAIVALVAVMIQGLLGGFRVRLDALFGPELAPIHGIFAQVVFCLLVSVAVLSGRRETTEISDASRRILSRASILLVCVLFVQLIWGALVRHRPDSLNQRLHLLTAFLAFAVTVWLIHAGLQLAKPRIKWISRVLGILLLLQVTLGVEAWMGKFGEEARAGQKASQHLAEAAEVTRKQAAMRSAHTLVGTGVLAAAVVFMLRVRVRTAAKTDSANDVWERAIAPEPALALSGKRP